MAVQAAPCWQRGSGPQPGIYTWCFRRCRHAKVPAGTCWVGSLAVDLRGLGKAISRFNSRLSRWLWSGVNVRLLLTSLSQERQIFLNYVRIKENTSTSKYSRYINTKINSFSRLLFNYLMQIFFTNQKKKNNCMKAHSIAFSLLHTCTHTHNKNVKCLNLRVYSAASVTTSEPSHTLPVCVQSHSSFRKKKYLKRISGSGRFQPPALHPGPLGSISYSL